MKNSDIAWMVEKLEKCRRSISYGENAKDPNGFTDARLHIKDMLIFLAEAANEPDTQERTDGHGHS